MEWNKVIISKLLYHRIKGEIKLMRNVDLAKLNFCELLNYGVQPVVKNSYLTPLYCSGYCIDCEKKGFFHNPGDGFDQMSHGCDTYDFEMLLGALPNTQRIIDIPILFLLENPGGDYANGNPVLYQGYKKQPPVNHYYWTPEGITSWPSNANSLKNLYGNYFAYLMNKHSLNNIYITNVIKCNIITAKKTQYDKQKSIEHCVNKWLKREIELFLPKIVFCFGRTSEEKFKYYSKKYNWNNIKTLYLYHPSAIYLAQRYHKTKQQMIDENDYKIEHM